MLRPHLPAGKQTAGGSTPAVTVFTREDIDTTGANTVDTGDLLALVGSADARDPVDGQVNGAAARRSPGSTLKPFIYAAAFERDPEFYAFYRSMEAYRRSLGSEGDVFVPPFGIAGCS